MKCNLTDSQRKLFKLANMATSGSQFARSSGTGKSFSEALILASDNPQYDKGLFIEFPDKYKFRTCCVQKLFLFCFCFDIQNNI